MSDGGLSLEATVKMVDEATSYIDLFGTCEGDKKTQEAHLKKQYQKIAKILHPDMYSDPGYKTIAENAFSKMQDFHAQAKEAIKDGTYGEVKDLATITTKKYTHSIKRKIGVGDLSDIYFAQSLVGSNSIPTIVKIASNPIDNDLIEAETRALEILGNSKKNEKFKPFVSTLVDSFIYAGTASENRSANVIAIPEKGFLTLEELKEAHFKNGLDPLHAAWIWRRLLAAIGFAHQNGVIHGAVLPSNILIHPEKHGVVLIDWCYSQIENADGTFNPINAIVDSKKDWYPDEVLSKGSPSAATDISIAARSMIFVLGGDPITGEMPNSVPLPMQRHFKGCISKSQLSRPDDAFLLLNEFDQLLEYIGKPFHPRVFRPLNITNSFVR
ncbi:MAG: hypothetical protein U0R17_02980 [Acidimicrobiia bacterium]